MEDVGTDDTVGSGSDSKGLVREASTATNEEDEHLVYDRTRFRKDKIQRCFNLYSSRRRVIIERGVEVAEFDERALRVRAVLEA
jgi:cation diffusion facilitator CzcD-associated flavoprotein CzcO